MKFEHPQLLVLMLLLIPAAYVIWTGYQKSTKTLASLYESDKGLRGRTIGLLVSSLALLASLLIAASGPRREIIGKENPPSGNFVLLMDVSRSMAARLDCDETTRLDRAKALVLEMFEEIPTAAFAVSAFTELSFPLTEFSFDRQYLTDVIEHGLSVEVVPVPGSDVENAMLVLMEKRLEPPVYGAAEYIILVSDGDFSEEVKQKLAQLMPALSKAGIKVVTVGVGSSTALPIPTLDERYQCIEGRYERSEGKEFYTQLFEEPLKYIADETGGRYFTETAREELIAFLRSQLKQIPEAEIPVQAKDISAPFLVIATFSLFCLIWTRRP